MRKKKALQKALSRKDKMTLNRVSLVKQVENIQSQQAATRNQDRQDYSKLRTYEKQENVFRVSLKQKFGEMFTKLTYNDYDTLRATVQSADEEEKRKLQELRKKRGRNHSTQSQPMQLMQSALQDHLSIQLKRLGGGILGSLLDLKDQHAKSAENLQQSPVVEEPLKLRKPTR